jgi:hypothetical protein
VVTIRLLRTRFSFKRIAKYKMRENKYVSEFLAHFSKRVHSRTFFHHGHHGSLDCFVFTLPNFHMLRQRLCAVQVHAHRYELWRNYIFKLFGWTVYTFIYTQTNRNQICNGKTHKRKKHQQ